MRPPCWSPYLRWMGQHSSATPGSAETRRPGRLRPWSRSCAGFLSVWRCESAEQRGERRGQSDPTWTPPLRAWSISGSRGLSANAPDLLEEVGRAPLRRPRTPHGLACIPGPSRPGRQLHRLLESLYIRSDPGTSGDGSKIPSGGLWLNRRFEAAARLPQGRGLDAPQLGAAWFEVLGRAVSLCRTETCQGGDLLASDGLNMLEQGKDLVDENCEERDIGAGSIGNEPAVPPSFL